MKQRNLRLWLPIFLLISMPLVFGAWLTLAPGRAPVAASSFVRIMPLGDSITAGVGSSSHGGYRVELWRDCQHARWHVTLVGSQWAGPVSLPDKDHEGHPGWRIGQISAYVVEWLRTYRPHIILLQIGTNDIIYNDHVSAAPQRLSHLIDQITTTLPEAILVVAQITPLRKPLLNQEVIAYNRTIPGIVQDWAARGKHVSYVDMYDAVPVGDLIDGIHPNDKGYALMSNVWYAALQTVMR